MTSSTISDAWFYRVKAATRDLVFKVGGVVRAGEKTGFSKTEVSRWQSVGETAIIPVPAILALEADCEIPLVTSVMADLTGHRVVGPDHDGGSASSVLSSHAEVVRAAGELMAQGAAAIADGKVTPAEAEILDRCASTVAESLEPFRQNLARVRAGQTDLTVVTDNGRARA